METPIALALLGVGLVLMTSAYRDESPIDVVLIALGRGPSTPAKLGAGGATLGLAGSSSSTSTSAPSSSSSAGTPTNPPATTGGGQGTRVQ